MKTEYTISPRIAELIGAALADYQTDNINGAEVAALNDMRAFFQAEARKARDTGPGVFIRLEAVLI